MGQRFPRVRDHSVSKLGFRAPSRINLINFHQRRLEDPRRIRGKKRNEEALSKLFGISNEEGGGGG